MGNCVHCFFQGDRNADDKGEAHVFCLVKGNWYPEKGSCAHYREYADLNKDVRVRFAAEIRQEEAESRRLTKISRSNWRMVVFTLIASFLLFLVAVKFFDKFIF
jgi:hypothetical protein